MAKRRLRAGDGPPEAVDPAAAYTLRTAHERFLRLFAPILAHVTEELWTEMYAAEAAVDSVHRTDWPEPLGVGADREAGATAMAVVGALRRYKSDRGLALNAPLAQARGLGEPAGRAADLRRVMHVDRLETTDEEAAVESVVTGVDLDYSTVGPRYGERVSEIDAAIEAGEFEVVDDRLAVAGVEIEPAAFELEAERRYTGAGEMIEADGAVVIVRED